MNEKSSISILIGLAVVGLMISNFIQGEKIQKLEAIVLNVQNNP